MNRERIAAWAELLLARFDVAVSLDDVSDAIGTELATTEDIEGLFAVLEARGLRIEAATRPPPATSLRAVLSAARALKAEGKAPTTAAIAAHAGLNLDEVRGALLFAVVLSR
jgi:hypothetical protein